MHSSFVSHRLSLTLTGILLSFFLPLTTHAATLYWVGNDGASTSTASNWKTTDPTTCGSGDSGAAPVAGDVVIFDRDCDNGASIDATLTVTTFTMQNGYTGTVTQANGIVITINGTLTQSGGTFTGGNSKINIVDGNFLLRGGTFTNTSETSSGMTVERNFTVNGGTFSNTSKKVTLQDSNSADDTIIACSTTLQGTFVITKDGGGDIKNATGCSINLGASPTTLYSNAIFTNSGTINITSGTWTLTGTSSQTVTNFGTISHAGDGFVWSAAGGTFLNAAGATFAYSGTTISMEDHFKQLGTFNLTGKTITFSDRGASNDTTIVCSGVLGGTVVITKDNDGDFKNSTGCTINLGASPTTTVDADAATDFTNSGTIIIASGTWTFIDSDVFGADLINFGTITHSGSGWTLTDTSITNRAGATMTYAGITISIERSFTQAGTFDLTGKTISFIDNSVADDTTATCSSIDGTVVITKDSGGDFINKTGCSINLGASPASVMGTSTSGIYTNSGTIVIPSGTWAMNGASTSLTNFGTITHSGNGWDIDNVSLINRVGGTITYAGTSITMERNFTQNGTFDLTGITITFDDDANSDVTLLSCSGTLSGTVVITKDSNSTFSLANGCSISLGSSPTTTFVTASTSIFTNSGTMVIPSGTWTLNGSTTSTFRNFGTITHSGNGWDINDLIFTNNTGATVTYAGTSITMERNFTQFGTFNLTGKTIILDDSNTADDTTLTCSNTLGGTVVISKDSGGDFKNATNCSISLGASPITTINGTATSPFTNSGTIAIASGTWTITGSGTLSNRGTITHSGNGWDINGVNLTNYATKTITYAGSSITLEGNLTQSGTLNLSSTTLIFDGSSSSQLLCGGTIGTLEVNKTMGTLSLASDCTVTNLTVTAGAFDLNGYDLTVSNTFSNNGTVSLLGPETVSWAMDIDSGTILYRGTGGILSLGSVYNNLMLQEGLVGYWKFDEGTGTSTADSSGLGHHGVLANGPSWSTAVPTTAYTNPATLSFDGTDDYVSFPAVPGYYGTIAFWSYFNSTITAATTFDPIIGNVTTTIPYFALGATSSSSATDETLIIVGTASPVNATYIRDEISSGWHHIALDWNGSFYDIYVDGTQRVTYASSTGGHSPQWNNVALSAAASHTHTNFSNINLDDLRIYSRALSSTEIAALASGSQYPTSSITYTLSAPLTVRGSLTVQGITLDTSSNRYALDYGSLTNNGIIDMHGSTTAQTQAGSGGGGGGASGRRSTPSSPITPSSSLEVKSILTRYKEGLLQSYLARKERKDKDLPKKSALSTFLEVADRKGLLLMLINKTPVLFTDIPTNSWFAPYIASLIEKNIAQGYKDARGNLTGIFGVANPVTKAEILKMVLEAKKEPLKNNTPTNTSAKGTWASRYIATAESLSLSTLKKDTNVHTPATRGEVIQTIVELMNLSSTSTAAFTDVPVKHPHAQAISTAASLGIISGDTDANGIPLNTFRPNDPINRAEVSKMVAILLEMTQKN